MTDDNWDDIQTIFADAIELSPSARASVLDARCAGRPAMRTEIESLLASHDRAGAFLNVATVAASGADVPEMRDHAGDIVGGFRLVEQIGEGGMGVVYRAERADGEFAEEVAVKLLTTPISSAEALRRFRVERQILATLNHPDIVTLIDGGLTPNGQPFLAMKYVDGVPIVDHCTRHRLALADRIRLFQRVCAAVQYAHQNGVGHRDLKPANILVTADGPPKILDFGVAKLIDRDGLPESTTPSVFQPLTTNYASPEQLRGFTVTTAADVYALGMILYEMLVGARPYVTTDKPLDEVIRLVVENDPIRPSQARPPDAAANQRPPYDVRALRGDLDAIVLRALRKSPEERYPSAAALADDLGRYLTGRPVEAREPSLGYVARKLAMRHKASFATAAIALLLIVGLLAVSLWQARVARDERDRAAARFDDARQLANALIFKLHDGVQALPGSTPVRKAIVAEALTYLERLSNDPTADVALRLELAKGYHRIAEVQGAPNATNLGDREGARNSLRRAVALLTPLVSNDREPRLSRDAGLELAGVQMLLTRVAKAASDPEEAQEAARRALAVSEMLVQRDGRDEAAKRMLGSAHFNMAFVASSSEGAVQYWERAARVFEPLLGARPNDLDLQRDMALVHKYLGGHYQGTGELSKALAYHSRALELDQRRFEALPNDRRAALDVAIDLGSVAWIHDAEGRLADAVTMYERSRDIRRRLAESDPKDDYARGRVAYALDSLARSYSKMNRHADALSHAREAVAIADARASIDAQNRTQLVDYLAGLAAAERAAGLYDRACDHVRRADALSRETPLAFEEERIRRQVRDGLAACAATRPRP